MKLFNLVHGQSQPKPDIASKPKDKKVPEN
jgi:hypothetical protein